MAWLSGALEFNAPVANRHDFNGDIVLKKEDILILHGAVIESETGKPTPEVLVELCARRKDGTEYPLGKTFSNDEGDYLLHINKRKITDDIAGIILRAYTDYRLPSTV